LLGLGAFAGRCIEVPDELPGEGEKPIFGTVKMLSIIYLSKKIKRTLTDEQFTVNNNLALS
jgi:hypothetical protein